MTVGEEQLHFWRCRHPEPKSYVYVVQGQPGTPIKIGVARDPLARLRGLQTGNPSRLRLRFVVPGGYRLEADFHRRLRDAAGIGEWFSGPEAEEFLAYMEEFSVQAIDRYQEHGVLPGALPAPKRINRQPLMARTWGSKPVQWRTTDRTTPNPVTVRYVDPKTLRP